MSSDPDDSGQEPPPDEDFKEQESITAYSVIKWLAIIFLGVPIGLIVVATFVFGICMLTMK